MRKRTKPEVRKQRQYRMSDSEMAVFERAAAISGAYPSAIVRAGALAYARRIISRHDKGGASDASCTDVLECSTALS